MDTSTVNCPPASAVALPTDICTVSSAATAGAIEQTESESIAAAIAPMTIFFVFMIFSSFFIDCYITKEQVPLLLYLGLLAAASAAGSNYRAAHKRRQLRAVFVHTASGRDSITLRPADPDA